MNALLIDCNGANDDGSRSLIGGMTAVDSPGSGILPEFVGIILGGGGACGFAKPPPPPDPEPEPDPEPLPPPVSTRILLNCGTAPFFSETDVLNCGYAPAPSSPVLYSAAGAYEEFTSAARTL